MAFSSSTPVLIRLGIFALLGGAASTATSGCVVESIFTCATDQNCIDEGGAGGVCEANSQCTFPDETCDEGKRWHARAVEQLEEQCFDPAHVEGLGTEGSSGGGGDTETEPPASTGEVPGDSSGEPPTTDTEVPATCDELFSSAPGYELCEETDHSCVFNAILDQSTCTALCTSFESTCVGAINNESPDCASMATEAPCDEMANDQICVCAK